jgi:hypothetical protein
VTPRLLDLFACAGGAAVGYHQAGFEVTGVDIVDRPNFPFTFIRGDAVAYLAHMIDSQAIRDFDLIHASPPCQDKCATTIGTNRSRGWGREHVDLVPAIKELLLDCGVPYVIEQPDGLAQIRKDLKLCGEMFGLGVLRHRNFELGGWTMPQPPHVRHRGRVRGMRHGIWYDGPYVAAYGNGGGKASIAEMQRAMEIDWTSEREELTEAIPPKYTRLIGTEFMKKLAA